MKNLIFTLLTTIITTLCFAQSPQKFSYQSVIRNSNNELISNQQIGVQVSILQNSINGNAVYEETHTITSNSNGLITLEIGTGTPVSGSFAGINWANGPYFFKTEIDPQGGNNYTIAGTTEALSVPYAMHAETVTNKDDADADSTNEIQTLSINGGDLSISGGNTITLPAGQSPQTLSVSGNQLTISNGNTVTLQDNVNDADSSVTNEIQDLSLTGNILTITNNGSATQIDLSQYLDNTNLTEAQVDSMVANNGYLTTEVDGSITNEIQDLSLTGNNLTITNNSSATTIDLSGYLDNTNLTEAQVDAMVSNNGYLTSEIDGSVTNETITSMTIANDSLKIVEAGNTHGVLLDNLSQGDWTVSGNNIFNPNTGNVSINTTSTTSRLNIEDTIAGGSQYAGVKINTTMNDTASTGAGLWVYHTSNAEPLLQGAYQVLPIPSPTALGLNM